MKEKKIQKLLSLILSVFMVFSVMTVPAFAAPTDNAAPEPSAAAEAADTDADKASEKTDKTDKETAAENNSDKDQKSDTISVEENFGTYKVDANDIDVSDVGTGVVLSDVESDKIDTDDPEIATIEEELKEITVLNDEGKSAALTEEQIQTILHLYSQYINQWKDNANVLGIQVPFFLQFNDTEKDGLGTLGEMLALAGYTVEDVRNGDYKYDDLVGMIQNFYYADKYAIEYYSTDILNGCKEAAAAVDKSGAKNIVQEMLVINDWLAHKNTFDMSYIMNMGKDEPVILAEEPQQHEHYDEIYDDMYALYEDQIRQTFRQKIEDGIKDAVYNQALEQAQAAYDDIYNQVYQGLLKSGKPDNEETAAIAEEQTQAQIKKIAEDAVTDVVDNGMPATDEQGDPIIGEDGNQVRVPLKDVIDKQMDQPLDDLGGKSPNQVIPVYAEQAATGLTNGIIGAWEGNHVGVFADGTSVCAGYSKAFVYLLQYMHPEIYGKNGAGTDMSKAENWKTADQLYYDKDDNTKLNINNDYLVDMVRITFDASVTMYGEKADKNFAGDHFWNAVKVDGKWYYIDPCYTDIYVECMSRDRVEIDGTMNHLYFMFSHNTALKMYDGNMKEIKSLYSDVATDTSYEGSWYSRSASNTYSDGNYFYYLYDSTDMLKTMGIMNDFSSGGDQNDIDFESLMNTKDPDYKLVRHKISEDDKLATDGDLPGDSDYETLIDFNCKENEDDETTVAKVYDPVNNEMVENELLTKLFAQFKEECDIYPSIKLTTALYKGKLYFNLSNCILSYDISSGDVNLVKKYDTVYAQRNPEVAFGGMGFSVVDSENKADFTVKDHPIAAMTIKEDGKMYVSIATNFAFISGKDAHSFADDAEKGKYGYEFEETNYNPDYSNYFDSSKYDDEQLAEIGYSREINDNDEFMWSAVFVDTLESNEFTTKSDTLKEDSLHDEHTHHYVEFNEEYYTKDDSGNWNTGKCYVCTICKYAVSEPTEPKKSDSMSDEDFKKLQAEYEEELEIYNNAVKTAGHTYVPTDAEWSEDHKVTFSKLECSSVCPEKESVLDCLIGDKSISVELDEPVTEQAEVTGYEGSCTDGATVVYTAAGTAAATVAGEAKDCPYTATQKVELEPGQHKYTGTFTWAEDNTSATADLTCEICGDKHEGVEAVVEKDTEASVAATCEKPGKDIFVATATVKDADDKVIGTVTDTKEIEIPATGHKYDLEKDPEFTWADDYSSATATFVCTNDSEHTTTVDCVVSDETTDATCTKEGSATYTATVTFEGKEFSDEKTEEIDALGHDYQAKFSWGKTDSGERMAQATLTCIRCNDKHQEVCEVTSETTEPTCTEKGKTVYTATCEFNGKEYSSDPVEEEIAATGHKYDLKKAPEFTWADDYSSATATFVCTDDSEHTTTVDCVVSEKTEGCTCTEAGTTTYTATVTFEGTDFKDAKEAKAPALGHEYSEPEFKWSDNEDGEKVAYAYFTCSRCEDEQIKSCEVTSTTTEPTCTEKGKTVYTATCEFNGKEYSSDAKTEVIPATGHDTKSELTKATATKDGTITDRCQVCGWIVAKRTIPRASSIKLSYTSYTYNGLVKTPTVTVKDAKGKSLTKNTDYTVSYTAGRKNVGTYKVTITLKGNYSGSKMLSFKINPKGTSISSMTRYSKAFTVKWKKQSTQTSGYQILYSTSSKFKSGNKYVTVTSNKTTAKKITKLKSKKKYYVKIRTYKTVNGTRYYSGWSSVKYVTTK